MTTERTNEARDLDSTMASFPELAKIRVLYRDGNLGLWGIPYDMRPGQAPRDIYRAHAEYVPPRPGWYGSKQVSIADWIWLGSPGWYGSKTSEQVEAIKAFLERYDPLVPGSWHEWSRLVVPCAACGTGVIEGDSWGDGEIGDADVPSFCSEACYRRGEVAHG